MYVSYVYFARLSYEMRPRPPYVYKVLLTPVSEGGQEQTSSEPGSDFSGPLTSTRKSILKYMRRP